MERHGEACCELDALDPNALRETVEAAILARLDRARWARAEMVERAQVASLGDFLATRTGAA
jgi:hypothetical protein